MSVIHVRVAAVGAVVAVLMVIVRGFPPREEKPLCPGEGNNSTEAVVFVYTGPGGEDVPRDVVRVRVDPSVTSIPDQAFYGRNKLTEVELCEGLVDIGDDSFAYCGHHSITKIKIPNSLRRINNYAFSASLRCPIRLHNGIESIGAYAFTCCIFTNFRVPPHHHDSQPHVNGMYIHVLRRNAIDRNGD